MKRHENNPERLDWGPASRPSIIDRNPSGPEASPTADAVLDQSSALVPADVLRDGEVILLILKPSTWFVILECLKSLTVFFLVTVLAMSLADRGVIPATRSDLILLGVGTGGIRLFWQFLEWLGRVYILTDKRTLCISGVTKVVIHELGLKQIHDIELHQSNRERTFGLGSVVFHSVKPEELHPIRWRMVGSPLQTIETVRRLVTRYR